MTVKQGALVSLPVTAVRGVGDKVATALDSLGIVTVGDLLTHWPHRYLDLSEVRQISRLKDGEQATALGIVKDVHSVPTRRRTSVVTVTIFDGTGYLRGVWFNQPFVADRFEVGQQVAFSGKVRWQRHQLQIHNPFFDVLGDEADALHTGRVIPIHPANRYVSATRLRRLISVALEEFGAIEDPLPAPLVDKFKLMPKANAVRQMHFPDGREPLRQARKRLVFEELFVLQLGLVLRKRRLEASTTGISHRITSKLLEPFYALLPFKLTADQRQVLREIRADLKSPRPMHRLLQGEVGSGKTVVAVAAMLMAVEGGYQAVLMTPTEVLAEQHYFKIKEMLEPLGTDVELLIGSQSAAEKAAARERIASHRADIIIGTHALIQKAVDFKRLGIAVIDEQHRFGVRQRIELRAKGAHPDLLVMTATPIPRTLSLTLYGDLDVSALRQLPAGRERAQVQTKLFTEARRARAYDIIREQVNAGRQAYVICPLIDESDKLAVKSVMREAETLERDVFPDLRVGVIHGKLAPADKDSVMRAFRGGELDILISTTVIEVGVDVPNASVMLIEHAERFGLSQLHQLRGRVGRGPWPSMCLLFADASTEDAQARLSVFQQTDDGFKLAEADLEIRGEGQLFGARQSGLPDLKLAKLTKHGKVVEVARREAEALLDADPALTERANAALLAELKAKFAHNLGWLLGA